MLEYAGIGGSLFDRLAKCSGTSGTGCDVDAPGSDVPFVDARSKSFPALAGRRSEPWSPLKFNFCLIASRTPPPYEGGAELGGARALAFPPELGLEFFGV